MRIMPIFQYHPDILERFPDLVGGVILARDLQNGPTPSQLLSSYISEQSAVLQRIGGASLSDIASLAAWRRAFRAFGVKPTQYRSAAEALLRRLTKHGDIPSINTLVDLANLVSIRFALPVAVFDTRALTLPVTVHFAEGDEPYVPLGRSETVFPESGEVVFSDEARRVIARRWCWRQSDDSAARMDTTQAVITVEAHHSGAHADIEAAVQDLLTLLGEYTTGILASTLLDSGHSTFAL
jgi:DNA/RNA-binding domain of Phe-tRNA-synthetase-like protein